MKVSVLMLAYNHAPYIARAIESVLEQQADFDWELVIGEDCSTDDTRAIVRRYADANPDRVVPLFHEHNLGMFRNLDATYRRCRGPYLAFLEGDDEWCDTKKLQKQVDAMESHPGWALCFHPVRVFTEPGAAMPETYRRAGGVFPNPHPGHHFNLEELHRTNFIQTCSLMIRKKLLDPLPHWFDGLKVLDWPLCILLAQHGEIGFLPEVMARYRVHAASQWSSRDDLTRLESTIEMFNRVLEHIDPRHQAIARDNLARLHTSALILTPGWSEPTRAIRHARGVLRRSLRAGLRTQLHCFPRLPFACAMSLFRRASHDPSRNGGCA